MTMPQNGKLEDALATLVQNQATLVQTETMFLGRLDESRQRFATIERDLAQIKSILLRHEKVLAELPETIRQKIGFQQ
jgi:hypothetical protein